MSEAFPSPAHTLTLKEALLEMAAANVKHAELTVAMSETTRVRIHVTIVATEDVRDEESL